MRKPFRYLKPKIKGDIDLKVLRRELDQLAGVGGFSLVAHDPYFAKSLEAKYNMSVSDLTQLVEDMKVVNRLSDLPKRTEGYQLVMHFGLVGKFVMDLDLTEVNAATDKAMRVVGSIGNTQFTQFYLYDPVEKRAVCFFYPTVQVEIDRARHG